MSHTRIPSSTAKSALLLLPVTLGAAALLAGCSSSTLDSQKLSSEITGQVQQLVPANTPVAVDCPKDVKPQTGGTFTCTLTVAGQTATIDVTQKDDQGNVSFESESAILFMNQAQEKITTELTKQVPGTWTTTCNPQGSNDGIYVAKPQTTFDCSVSGTTAAGEQQNGTVEVTVTDNKGNITWKVKQ